MKINHQHLSLNQVLNQGKGTLDIYSLDDTSPLIIVCPGGGYEHISSRESMPVVNKFNALGYNVALLTYSIFPECHLIQLKEVNYTIEYLSKTYKKIFILGFSAGGHLAGLGATSTFASLLSGMILCYPVISLGAYTHSGTRDNFLYGINNKENQDLYSINLRVNQETCPAFIWATKTDASVNVKNSLMMKEALDHYHIYNELVLFEKGPHGMALADETSTLDGHLDCYSQEVAIWPNLVDKFIKKVLNTSVN